MSCLNNHSTYEPGSEKIALNSFVFIGYNVINVIDVMNKGKWFILGLILSKINAFQLVLVSKYSYTTFSRAIFSEPGYSNNMSFLNQVHMYK